MLQLAAKPQFLIPHLRRCGTLADLWTSVHISGQCKRYFIELAYHLVAAMVVEEYREHSEQGRESSSRIPKTVH